MDRNSSEHGRLSGRLAVITGASRGIGRAVACAFADEGAHVILLARTVGGLEEVDDEIKSKGGSATLVPADITDFDALDRLGASIYERWGKLDILVGNAGILGTLTPLGHIAPKEWRRVIDTNLTANWRLVRSLDPLLQKSDAARVIFVSSGVAQSHKAYWATYAVSKAGLEALSGLYAAENMKSPLCCNVINPGPMRTHMRAKAMPGEDPQKLPRPREVAPLFVELASPAYERTGDVIDYRAWRTAQNQGQDS